MSGFSTPAPYAPAYVSGRYYSPDGQFVCAGGNAVATGSIYLTAGIIRKAVTISALVVRLITLAAGGNVKIALYASDPVSGLPTGNPLFTSANQSTAATGLIEVAASLTLTPGVYHLAIQCDNATAAFQVLSNLSMAHTNVTGELTNAHLFGTNLCTLGYVKTGTFGTLPTLTGNATTDALSDNLNHCPAWAFKVA